jgi:hypothetical protein
MVGAAMIASIVVGIGAWLGHRRYRKRGTASVSVPAKAQEKAWAMRTGQIHGAGRGVSRSAAA